MQVVVGLAIAGLFARALVRSWDEIRPRLDHLNPWWLGASLATITVYYLVFIVGWRMVLYAFGHRISYRQAVVADIVSMLAKYLPGGVWTPAARVVMCRRYGLPAGPVLASVGYEAGLSAIAGVLVFLGSLTFHPTVKLPVPLWVMAGGTGVLLILLHPSIYGPVADRVLRPLGKEPIPRLSMKRALVILLYYAGTWVVSGISLVCLIRAVEPVSFADETLYVAGVGAVGAIVTVLAYFTPGGIGAREGAMYALLIPVVADSTAFVTVTLSRVVITVAELVILAGASGLHLRTALADARQANLGEERT